MSSSHEDIQPSKARSGSSIEARDRRSLAARRAVGDLGPGQTGGLGEVGRGGTAVRRPNADSIVADVRVASPGGSGATAEPDVRTNGVRYARRSVRNRLASADSLFLPDGPNSRDGREVEGPFGRSVGLPRRPIMRSTLASWVDRFSRPSASRVSRMLRSLALSRCAASLNSLECSWVGASESRDSARLRYRSVMSRFRSTISSRCLVKLAIRAVDLDLRRSVEGSSRRTLCNSS